MKFNVIIIGGGIIGVTAAYEISKERQSVLVVDKADIGSGASGTSAAMLEFQTDAHRGEPFYSLAEKSNALFPQLEDEIQKLVGRGFQYERCGILNLALNEQEAEELKTEALRQRAIGLHAHWYEAQELQEAYPAIDPDHFGGAFFTGDGQVNCEHFISTVMLAAKRLGAQVKTQAGKLKFVQKDNRVIGIELDGETFEADKIIIAAGAWTDEVLGLLDLRLGIYPLRGQLLIYDTPAPPLPCPVYTRDRGYITPKKDGYTLVGTTVEKVGFDNATTAQAKTLLIEKGKRILPSLSRAEIKGMTAGLRPSTDSRLPFIGPLPGHSNLFVGAGHFRNGILLAPITAKILAAFILNKPQPINVEPFNARGIFTQKA